MTEATQIKVIESGVNDSPILIGGNILRDAAKIWAPGIHADRLLLVKEPSGRQHTFRIASSGQGTLSFTTGAQTNIPAKCQYEILEDTAAELADSFAALGTAIVDLGTSITSTIGSAAGIELGAVHNQAVVGGANIFGAVLVPTDPPCRVKVVAAFNAQGILSGTVIRGGNTQIVQFNTGVPLLPNCVYGFDLLLNTGDTVNYRYSVNATCLIMRVQEF